MELDNLVKQLQLARNRQEVAKAERDTLLEQLQATPEWKEKYAAHEEVKTLVENLETDIKEMAVAEYKTSGNKKPHEAVQIKLFSTVDILNEAAAREWCFLNFRPALKLDTNTFEKAAKDGSIPAELATVSEEPRAQIATKL